MKQKINHLWKVSISKARKIQQALKRKRVLRKPVKLIKKIAAADVSFINGKVFGVVAVFSYPELKLLEEKSAAAKAGFPYVPGFLTFREGPILLKVFAAIKNEPDVILFDGQGIAHPMGLGEAAHLGVILDKPSIGCAKSRLVGDYKEPGKNKGARSPLIYQGEIVGLALRTRENTKPVFVSPGHKMDVKSAAEIVMSCAAKYRIPEPLRYAHQKSIAYARNKKTA